MFSKIRERPTMRFMITLRSRLVLAIMSVLFALFGGAVAAQDTPLLTAERPVSTWDFLREAAAAEGAAPDGFITYTGTAGQTHRIEIFRPRTSSAMSAGSWPAIVLFHGGAWREGAPVQFYRQARVLADAGFIVALPEYSLREEDGTTPRDSVVDAFRAWSTIRSVAVELEIDPDRLFAGGASAGGRWRPPWRRWRRLPALWITSLLLV